MFHVPVDGMVASQQPTAFLAGNVADAAYDVFFVGVINLEIILKK